MEDEIWKDVEGYEGLYQVSNKGMVRSLNRMIKAKDGKEHKLRGKIIASHTINGGYFQVRLNKNGKRKGLLVHRLVAESFIPNPGKLPQINHKDEDKSNNKVENLEWISRIDNMNYGTRNQRISNKLTNNHKISKQVYQYTLDDQLLKIWASTMECTRNDFNNSKVSACCRGEKKTYRGFRWSYKPLEAPNA